MTIPPNQPPDPPFASNWKVVSPKETRQLKPIAHPYPHQGHIFYPLDTGDKIAQVFYDKLKEKKE